jgi:hypothetical protein
MKILIHAEAMKIKSLLDSSNVAQIQFHFYPLNAMQMGYTSQRLDQALHVPQFLIYHLYHSGK